MKRNNELLDVAMKHTDDGEINKAIEIYHQILKADNDWSTPHYNLGLIYKYELKWQESFDHNLKAVELDPECQACHWNLGMAATMLKEWRIARKCWNQFGLKYEENDEDPAEDIGISPIRLNPDADAEIIWATRIDPARARITSIPFPESDHRFGDLILNDGAPMGKRLNNGVEYSVLNELQLLEESNYQTFSIKCDFGSAENFQLLESSCAAEDIEIENWTSNIQLLCKECSEGVPHEDHKPKPVFKDKVMTIAFASESEDLVSRVINQWSRDTGIDFDEFWMY